jgi:signal transduction histidine kinase
MRFGRLRNPLRAQGGILVPASNHCIESLPRSFEWEPGSGSLRERFRIMSNLCHELRTPLQIFDGYLDILSEDWSNQFSAEPLRILHRLQLNAAELTQTIENLLEYAAGIAGTQATAIEPVNLADLVAEMEAAFAAAADEKNISLCWRVEPDLIYVHSDRRRLRSIISNLVRNAIKFTDRGEVTVRMRRLPMQSGCAVELEVADTGIGMDEGRVSEASQPFVQLSDSNSRDHRGLGLGLALVTRNVKSLGATLEVRSEPARGACFKIRFPQCARL